MATTEDILFECDSEKELNAWLIENNLKNRYDSPSFEIVTRDSRYKIFKSKKISIW